MPTGVPSSRWLVGVLQIEQLVAVVAAVEAVVAAVRLVRRIRGLLSLSGANLFLLHRQRSVDLRGRAGGKANVTTQVPSR